MTTPSPSGLRKGDYACRFAKHCLFAHMKNNPKIKPVGVQPGTKRGPYDTDSDSPFKRLAAAKAEAQEFENKREREKWQTREEAESAAQETAETIQSDLYSTLPLALAGKLSGRIFTAPEVRLIIRNEIDGMVRQWVKGERVSDKAIPQE